MTRERFPSDETYNERRRKIKPHVRIHHSVKAHPRVADLWRDPEQRGMLVELWRLASLYGAAHTDNWLSLAPGDIVSITGRTQYAHASRALRTLCARMEYAIRERGACVEIHVRKFAEKQGLLRASTRSKRRNLGATPLPTPHTTHPAVVEIDPSKKKDSKGIVDGAELELRDSAVAELSADAEPEPFNGCRLDPVIKKLCEGTKNFRSLAADRYVDFWKTTEAAFFGEQSPVILSVELQRADSWLEANPQRRPTVRGLPRFMRNWLERAVEIERRKVVTLRAQGQKRY